MPARKPGNLDIVFKDEGADVIAQKISKIRSELTKSTEALQQIGLGANKTKNLFRHFGEEMERLRGPANLGSVFKLEQLHAFAMSGGVASKTLKVLKSNLSDASESATTFGASIRGVVGSTFLAGTAVAGLGAIIGGRILVGALSEAAGAMFDFGTSVIETSSNFERMQIQLNTVFRSSQKGEEVFAWVKELALRTPFTTAELTEMAAALKAVNIDPRLKVEGREILLDIGDLAGATGRSLYDAFFAVKEAIAEGQFFSLMRRFSISISQVKSHLQSIGKDVDFSTVEGRTDAIVTYIRGKFGGGMDALAKSFSGITARISDAWTLFLDSIGKSEFFAEIKKQASDLADFMQTFLLGVGGQGIAKGLGGSFASAVRVLRNALNNLFKGVDLAAGFGTALTQAIHNIRPAFKSLWETVKPVLIAAWEEVKPVLKAGLAELGDFLKETLAAATNTLSSLLVAAVGPFAKAYTAVLAGSFLKTAVSNFASQTVFDAKIALRKKETLGFDSMAAKSIVGISNFSAGGLGNAIAKALPQIAAITAAMEILTNARVKTIDRETAKTSAEKDQVYLERRGLEIRKAGKIAVPGSVQAEALERLRKENPLFGANINTQIADANKLAAAIQDITEKRKAEAEAAKAARFQITNIDGALDYLGGNLTKIRDLFGDFSEAIITTGKDVLSAKKDVSSAHDSIADFNVSVFGLEQKLSSALNPSLDVMGDLLGSLSFRLDMSETAGRSAEGRFQAVSSVVTDAANALEALNSKLTQLKEKEAGFRLGQATPESGKERAATGIEIAKTEADIKIIKDWITTRGLGEKLTTIADDVRMGLVDTLKEAKKNLENIQTLLENILKAQILETKGGDIQGRAQAIKTQLEEFAKAGRDEFDPAVLALKAQLEAMNDIRDLEYETWKVLDKQQKERKAESERILGKIKLEIETAAGIKFRVTEDSTEGTIDILTPNRTLSRVM